MAGASANHNRIALNFCRRFPLEIQEQFYEVFMSDMRLWLPFHQSYTYPDVMVVAGEPDFTDRKQTALTNPILIGEILSDSTEGYDKSDKFRLYRSLPQFQEYLLFDQRDYRVEQFTRLANSQLDQNQWLMTEVQGEAATLSLKSAPVTLGLKDLHQRVQF
jgi:Uma2 family endonuclease